MTLTTDYRTPAVSEPQTEQVSPRVRARHPGRALTARLVTAIVLAVLVALGAAGCGRHLHVTVHSGQQTAYHVMAR